MSSLLETLETAYLVLLKMAPADRATEEVQNGLCHMRDAITAERGWDAEQTQNHYEAIAATMPGTARLTR